MPINLNNLIKDSITKKTAIDSIFKSLTFIIIIRTYIEMLLGKNHSFKYNPDFYTNIIGYIHMYLFWLCLFFTVSILITLFLKIKYTESLKLIMWFSPLILIPPLVDFILTRGEGGYILYSFEINSFLYDYINCFNPFAMIETVTTGARIEIAAASLFSFYVSFYVLEKGILRSVFLSIFIYTASLIYGYLPAFYKIFAVDFYELSGRAVTEITRSQKFLFMYLFPVFLILCTIIFILYRENRENLRSTFFFLYPGRLLLYILLLVFGFLFLSSQSNLYPQILNLEDVMRLFSAIISITFLFIYAKIINDIHDLEIDRVSNRERPLVKNTLSLESADQIKNTILPLSFVFALSAEISFVFYWLFIWALSCVYSAPPFRFRRYYPVGHFILSSVGLSVFIAGGSIVRSYDVYNALLQKWIILYIFLAFFFIAHAKDFKDMEGDRTGGVYNLLNYIRFPKTVAVVLLSGFTVSMYFIAKLLNTLNVVSVIGTMLFYAGSVFYISKAKDIRKLDRLLLFSLVFSVYIIAIWIFKITP